jgi:hypothetical protein
MPNNSRIVSNEQKQFVYAVCDEVGAAERCLHEDILFVHPRASGKCSSMPSARHVKLLDVHSVAVR